MPILNGLTKTAGILPAFFLLCGVYFSFSTRWINLRGLSPAFRVLFSPYRGKGVSPRRGLLVSLGAVMGPGNLLGVAAAVAYGGPGAVFWMWVSGLFGMALRFAETSLSALSRQKHGKNTGLIGFLRDKGYRKLGLFFAFTGVTVSLLMADLTSVASFILPLRETLPLSPVFTGFLLSLAVLPVIMGGGKKVLDIAPWVVAFLSGLYLISGLFILILLPGEAFSATKSILFSALDLRPAAIGTTFGAVRQGILKGVYSNECGLGSEPMISGETDLSSPALQGKVSMLSPFFDTVIFGGLSGILCVMSGEALPERMLPALFERLIPGFGQVLFWFLLGLLVYATLISWYFCGEGFWKLLTGCKGVILYRLIYLTIPLLAAFFKLKQVYVLCDASVTLMAIPSLYSLLLGRREVRKLAGSDSPIPEFTASECGNHRPH